MGCIGRPLFQFCCVKRDFKYILAFFSKNFKHFAKIVFLHGLRQRVTHANCPLRQRTEHPILDYGFLKILAVYRNAERNAFGCVFIIDNCDPNHAVIHKNVLDEHFIAHFHVHIVVNAHAGRTMMPTELCIIPADAGSGIKLVALCAVALTVLVAHVDEVVVKLNFQTVATHPCHRGKVKLKRRKKALVGADAAVVDIYHRLVICALEADVVAFGRVDLGKFKG